MDSDERYRKIRAVLLTVLFFNWGVAAAKLIYGFMIRSASIKADGFHSFSDGFSNMIGLLGIWIASQPKDPGHPYGHKKFETLTSVAISILLFLVAFNVAREGVLRLLHPVVPEIAVNSFIIMGVTLLINVAVMVYETRKGRTLRSDILISDALAHAV